MSSGNSFSSKVPPRGKKFNYLYFFIWEEKKDFTSTSYLPSNFFSKSSLCPYSFLTTDRPSPTHLGSARSLAVDYVKIYGSIWPTVWSCADAPHGWLVVVSVVMGTRSCTSRRRDILWWLSLAPSRTGTATSTVTMRTWDGEIEEHFLYCVFYFSRMEKLNTFYV